MGRVKTIAKYNLKKQDWDFNFSEEERGKAFSIASYRRITNNESNKYDYIIFCDGCRLEDHSKDMKTINESKSGIDKIINFFKKSDRNVVVKLVLIDKDAPIDKDSKMLANYITSIAYKQDINSINVIGFSKCGTMVFNMAKYITDENAKRKTNIFTIATPFKGTLMASTKYFYPKIREVINSKIKDEKLSNQLTYSLIKFYESISSNSHMDYDIAIESGIPKSKYDRYDENFIKNIFSKENIEGINNINYYQNFTTGIDSNTLKESIKTSNFVGIGLCILNEYFMGGKTDGFVPTESQKVVEKYLNNESYHLKSSHHAVITSDRLTNEYLTQVNEYLKKYDNVKKL